MILVKTKNRSLLTSMLTTYIRPKLESQWFGIFLWSRSLLYDREGRENIFKMIKKTEKSYIKRLQILLLQSLEGFRRWLNDAIRICQALYRIFSISLKDSHIKVLSSMICGTQLILSKKTIKKLVQGNSPFGSQRMELFANSR